MSAGIICVGGTEGVAGSPIVVALPETSMDSELSFVELADGWWAE